MSGKTLLTHPKLVSAADAAMELGPGHSPRRFHPGQPCSPLPFAEGTALSDAVVSRCISHAVPFCVKRAVSTLTL